MAEPKTRPTKASVQAFLKTAAGTPERLRDLKAVMAMMRKATGVAPEMWGPGIVGFGRCNMGTPQKPSEWPVIGFSPRKPDFVLYITPSCFDSYPALMARLGSPRTGKSCLYLRRLEGLDVEALQSLIDKSVATTRKRYPGVKVGVVGVGAMGQGVARALLAKGFSVHAHDIVAERQAQAVAAGAIGCATALEVATAASVVITLVVDADQTRDVLFGSSGAAGALSAASTVIMSSTIAPRDAEAIAERLAGQGVAMIDAPISGGPARAHAGTLSVMTAGSDAAFARCPGVLEAISARIFRIGSAPGDGSRMKVVNNMLAAANLAAGCEALAVAAKLGLDLRQVRDVVNASSGGSWIFTDRMARALEGDEAVHAAARVLTKDVGLFTEVARALGLEAPMAESAQRIFIDTVERGLGEEDDAAVLKRYAQAYGIRLD